MLVTDLTNVRYLTGFTGTNGACVCGPGLRLFFTDFRYTERAAAEVEGWEALTVGGDWLAGIAEHLEGRVGFEDDHMAVRVLEKLKEKLPEGVEPVAAGGGVEELRRVKDDEELAAIAEASKLADEVWAWASSGDWPGAASATSPAPTEARIRELGAEPSFPAIVAAGPNGALPHAEPGERVIGSGELVVFDMGAQARRLLLRRHPHLRHRRAGRGGARGLRGRAAGPAGGARRDQGGRQGRGRRQRRPQGDRRRRPRRALRPRARPRGRARGARGPAALAALRRRSRAGRSRHRRAGGLPAGKLGVRIEDLVVVTEEGLHNLSSLPKELQLVD